MKKLLLITIALLAATTPPAAAATVNVRIEGQGSTLFEGPVVSQGRNVQSLSERSSGAIRRCDGTNNGGTRAPTATAATADALSILGKGFDGQWYDEYEDYLITRLGDEVRSWRLFKNEGFTVVGGCQLRLVDDDRVLWAAAGGSPLALTQPSGSTVHTAAGAQVYEAGVDGSEGPTLGQTDGAGDFTVTGLGAGWHRIKARKSGSVRSNRVDLCVDPCGDKPADMLPRTPPAPVFYGPGGSVIPGSPDLATTTSPVRISRPTAGRSGYRRGRITVSWRVLQEGVGMLRWAISADDLSTRTKRYVDRARGTTRTSASLKLPAGRTYALRFTSTDRLLREDVIGFGRVVVPIDDRALRRSGPWRRLKASKAWNGTVLRGRRGARIRVKLAAGRPAVLTRARTAATVRIGSKSVRVRAGRRTVLGSKRRRAGTVTVSVTRGSIDLDGVAASP